MKPRYFVASRSGHATSLYLKLLKTVEAQGMTVVQPSSKPRKIELGSVELTLFPQPPEDRKEENNNSIGLRLSYGSFSMLLTGDSEETERQWWLRNDPEPGAQLHDSQARPPRQPQRHRRPLAASSCSPELAVASMGQKQRITATRTPRRSACSGAAASRFLRTDQLGTITITSDGRDWQVAGPALARTGRPTQADVDRVAAATEDDSPRR